MKLTKIFPYLVVVFLVFLSITNDTVSSALLNFLMAGIVPGTAIQLPWYAVLILVPLLLFGVWQLIRSIDFVPKDWVAPEKTSTKKTAAKRRRSHRKNQAATASAKKGQARSKATRKRTQKKLSTLTQAEA
ncbi:MAG TPA: hypothetical protein VFZ58_00265 [Candidatus Saccharimonadales bacterium]